MDFFDPEGPRSSEAQKAVGGLSGALEGKSTFNDLRPTPGQSAARFASALGRGPGARAGWRIGQSSGSRGAGAGKPPFPGESGTYRPGPGPGRPGPGARAGGQGPAGGQPRGHPFGGFTAQSACPRARKASFLSTLAPVLIPIGTPHPPRGEPAPGLSQGVAPLAPGP